MKENKIKFNVICAVLDTTPEQLSNPSQTKELVELRMFAAVFMRHCDFKYKEIGDYLRRDHSTVMNMIKRHKEFLKYDESYRARFLQYNEGFFAYSEFFNSNDETEVQSLDFRFKKMEERLERIEMAVSGEKFANGIGTF